MFVAFAPIKAAASPTFTLLRPLPAPSFAPAKACWRLAREGIQLTLKGSSGSSKHLQKLRQSFQHGRRQDARHRSTHALGDDVVPGGMNAGCVIVFCSQQCRSVRYLREFLHLSGLATLLRPPKINVDKLASAYFRAR